MWYKRLLAAAIAAMTMFAADAARPVTFGSNGEFKIMQLTDLHLRSTLPDECRKVFDRIDLLVAKESPDMIVVTGDLIYGKPAAGIVGELIAKLDSFGIPWGVTYGNHDAEQDLSRAEMSAMYVGGRNCVNTLNEKGELADIEIPVLCNGVPAYYIYLMDSHDYSPVRGIGTYGYFSFDQVQWLYDWCRARTAEDGSVAPSLAFFHIPLQEFVDAWAPMEDARQGRGDKKHCIGIRGENIAAGALNTGMFAAMRMTGSIVGVFCGHDHNSDFLACYKGIALGYGRFSGCNSVYNDLQRGARIIKVKPGEHSFETWIIDDDCRIKNHVTTDGKTLERLK